MSNIISIWILFFKVQQRGRLLRAVLCSRARSCRTVQSPLTKSLGERAYRTQRGLNVGPPHFEGFEDVLYRGVSLAAVQVKFGIGATAFC